MLTNRVVFKIKNGYKLELLSKETMKLLHCNLVNNSYQQASRVLFTFVPNKQYCQLISISPNSLFFLKKDEY